MTIGKKIYLGFGAVLAVLLLLFLVNVVAAFKARSARLDASATLASYRIIEAVRFQIMSSRVNLDNFLLSGDPSDEEKVTRGFTELSELIKRRELEAGNEELRHALIQVEASEQGWAESFAKPLLAKRHPEFFRERIEVHRFGPLRIRRPVARACFFHLLALVAAAGALLAGAPRAAAALAAVALAALLVVWSKWRFAPLRLPVAVLVPWVLAGAWVRGWLRARRIA